MRQRPKLPEPEPVPNLSDSPLGDAVNAVMLALPVTVAVGALAAFVLGTSRSP